MVQWLQFCTMSMGTTGLPVLYKNRCFSLSLLVHKTHLINEMLLLKGTLSRSTRNFCSIKIGATALSWVSYHEWTSKYALKGGPPPSGIHYFHNATVNSLSSPPLPYHASRRKEINHGVMKINQNYWLESLLWRVPAILFLNYIQRTATMQTSVQRPNIYLWLQNLNFYFLLVDINSWCQHWERLCDHCWKVNHGLAYSQ